MEVGEQLLRLGADPNGEVKASILFYFRLSLNVQILAVPRRFAYLPGTALNKVMNNRRNIHKGRILWLCNKAVSFLSIILRMMA